MKQPIILVLFALFLCETSHCQNLYTLGNSVDAPTWYKLGTLSLDQQGRDAIIRISGGWGYNAMINQNAEAVIHFRTSNGNSQNNGFYGTGSFFNTGRSIIINKIRVVQINQSVWEFYASLNSFTGEGANLLVESAQGSWTKDFQQVNNPPSDGIYNDLNEELIFQSPVSFNQNVGIGTINPLYRLSINGILGAGNNTRGDGGHGGIDFTDNGIGYSQAAKIYTFRSLSSGEYYGFTNDYDGVAAQLSLIAKGSSGNICFYAGDPATLKMKITSSGNVGIGTTNPAYKLDVLGTIRAKEVLVNLDGGADFVFEKGYKLLPIEHVANYVQENKHLPNIPSANEMVKNGVSMGDMQVKLLQKVEELTLYAIQQNKKIESMQKENEQYKAKKNNLLAEQQQQLLELKKEIENLKKSTFK